MRAIRASLDHAMRSASIPKTVETALNTLFDTYPNGVDELLKQRVPRDDSWAKVEAEEALRDKDRAAEGMEPLTGHGSARSFRVDETLGALDVANTILEALSPGQKIGLIYADGKVQGFTLLRVRAPKVVPVPLATES